MRTPKRIGLFGATLIACAASLSLFPTRLRSEIDAPVEPVNAPVLMDPWDFGLSFLLQDLMRDQQQQLLQALERMGNDTYAALRRQTEVFDSRLLLLEQALDSTRKEELEAWNRLNQFALLTVSGIAGALFLEVLFLALLAVRAINRLASRVSGPADMPVLPPESTRPNESKLSPSEEAAMFEASVRLQSAIGRLENRVRDLEKLPNRAGAAENVSPETLVSAASVPERARHAAPAPSAPGVSLAVVEGESLIFLPHEKAAPVSRPGVHFLQRLRLRLLSARAARTHPHGNQS